MIKICNRSGPGTSISSQEVLRNNRSLNFVCASFLIRKQIDVYIQRGRGRKNELALRTLESHRTILLLHRYLYAVAQSLFTSRSIQ